MLAMLLISSYTGWYVLYRSKNSIWFTMFSRLGRVNTFLFWPVLSFRSVQKTEVSGFYHGCFKALNSKNESEEKRNKVDVAGIHFIVAWNLKFSSFEGIFLAKATDRKSEIENLTINLKSKG